MKKVEVEIPVNEIVLTLSLEEALAVRIVLGQISGVVEGTVREYTDKIHKALADKVPKLPADFYGVYVRADVDILHCSLADRAVKHITEACRVPL